MEPRDPTMCRIVPPPNDDLSSSNCQSWADGEPSSGVWSSFLVAKGRNSALETEPLSLWIWALWRDTADSTHWTSIYCFFLSNELVSRGLSLCSDLNSFFKKSIFFKCSSGLQRHPHSTEGHKMKRKVSHSPAPLTVSFLVSSTRSLSWLCGASVYPHLLCHMGTYWLSTLQV